jgi:putative spermidine/putrescine transport system permease protein
MKLGISARIFRALIIFVTTLYLAIPLYGMLDFSTKPLGNEGGRTLEAWKAIGGQEDLTSSISVSFAIAIIVMLLIFLLVVPTVIWVHLKLPKLRRPLELICLLPLAIPAIVIVVGIAPLYRWISINVTESAISLSGVYAILILPYTYRSLSAALDLVDIATLAEAARTLGASTMRTIFGIVMPTIRSGIMSGVVISLALVLGEFTISALLSYDTLQVVIYMLGLENGKIAVAVSLAALIFVFAILFAIPTTKRQRVILDADVA